MSIEEMLRSGKSVEEIMTEAKEAEARIAAEKQAQKETNLVKDRMIICVSDLAKNMGLELSVEDCSLIVDSLEELLSTLKFFEQMGLNPMSQKKKSNKREKITDAEADEILKKVIGAFK